MDEIAALTQPDRVVWCDGSEAEYELLCEELVAKGTFKKLDESKRPNSYYAASDPSDVARVEDRTFICSEKEEDAGPTNHWKAPAEMKEIFAGEQGIFRGSMKGRTMYVVPFCMGPLGSELSAIGVEITDSAYVAVAMRTMTRMGQAVLDELGTDGFFVKAVHTLGAPLADGQADVPWPCNTTKYISHFPETREIWSFGSGYGGNALLGKKCYALRIASVMARDEGWLAEHMLILKLTPPAARARRSTSRPPSRPRAARPTSPCWSPRSPAGRSRPSATTSLDALRRGRPPLRDQPRGRLLRRRPRHRRAHQRQRHEDHVREHRLHQRCAHRRRRRLVGGHDRRGARHLVDWKGNDWTPDSETPAAHPNARFAVPASQCPTIAPEWEDPKGVPVSAILFGGRRASAVPLVTESFDWNHGVFIGSNIASEKTAAAEGKVGELRRDPFAMLPFCGYNMGDYMAHWVKVAADKDQSKLPKIYYVNWFRKNDAGKFVWPGFGENSRVLKWIVGRLDGTAEGTETPIGILPTKDSLDLDGLDLPAEDLDFLLTVDKEVWREEAALVPEHLNTYGDHTPKELWDQYHALVERLAERLSRSTP